jgi:hypothetical protein
MKEQVFVLIKDYGYEGQGVYGVTREKRIAELWCLGDYCYFVVAEVEGKITNNELPAIK